MVADVFSVVGAFAGQVGADEELSRELGDCPVSLAWTEPAFEGVVLGV